VETRITPTLMDTGITMPGLLLRISRPELSVRELPMLPPVSLMSPEPLLAPMVRGVLTRSR